jgi:glycosyltransferase involved in cell wall biosynthesis
MRVLHVIPSVAARYGGPSTAIVPMCRGLIAAGTDALIATTDADGDGRLTVPLDQPTTWQGIPAIFFERTLGESVKYSRGLSRWLHGHVEGFDIVHVHALLSHASLAACRAARAATVPYIVRPLGTLAPWSLAQNPLRKRALLALGAKRLLLGAAAIQCTSAREKQDLEAGFGVSTAVVVPLGIDEALLTGVPPDAGTRTQDRYCLALSRIHPKKNLESVITSFLAAAARHPRWRMVVAGEGDAGYVNSLRSLAASLPGGDRVSFAGWVDGDRKRRLIGGASLFVIGSFHENFGISVVEALGCGVPVLATESVEVSEDVRSAEAGWIVEATVSSLQRGFESALSDDAALQDRSERARVLAARFTWESVVTSLTRLYAHLAAGGSGASFRPSGRRVLSVSSAGSSAGDANAAITNA